MKKLAVFLVLGLLFTLAAVALADPVRTETNYSAEIGCENCEGEPLRREFRECVEREMQKGETGEQRRQQRQRFGM